MRQLVTKALNCKSWVVVGATQNPEKFGNRIYLRLKREGYDVYALNPIYPQIDGDPCYPSPVDLPVVPECASMVVAPEKGVMLLESLYEQGVRLLWFQPGAYDQKILDTAVAMGFDVIYDHCVLVELNHR